MMPILRTFFRSVSTSSATGSASSLGGALRDSYAGLPAIVRERPVRLGHLVHILVTLNCGAQAVGRIEDFVRKALSHRLFATNAREVDYPAQCKCRGTARTHLD